MSTPAPSALMGRPADRMNHVVRELRGRIVDGSLQPGVQLPTRVEIEEHYGVSSVTVQRALEHLRRDGFIEVNGRKGTFVAPNPPHLINYALIFPHRRHERDWLYFWTALADAATKLESGPASGLMRFPVYYDIDDHTDSIEYLRLEEDINCHRLAGLIFATSPYLVQETPLLRDIKIPYVSIQDTRKGTDGIILPLDGKAFRRRALEHLISRGRRRIALLATQPLAEWPESWRDSAAELGIEIPSYWMQSIHIAAPESACNTVHLMMRQDQASRPDGLIITDDNMVEPAVRGLLAAGIDVPGELEVVAHANFPLAEETALPLRRLGYDASNIVAACVQAIGRHKVDATEKTAPAILPVFEDELTNPKEIS